MLNQHSLFWNLKLTFITWYSYRFFVPPFLTGILHPACVHHPHQHQQKSHFTLQLHSLPSITSNLFSSTITIMPSTKHVTQRKIQWYMPHSHEVLCLAFQESCLTPQLLQQYLSKNDSCHTSWLNSSNSGTWLAVLRSPKPTKKTARAQWSEFSAIKSDDDDDNDDNFLYDQSFIFHLNPFDESDDSLSDSSFHNNYKRDNLSSDLLCQDEETDSTSEREGGSDKETDSWWIWRGSWGHDEYREGVEDIWQRW